MKITEKEIKKHIEENMEKWIFVGHVADCHINATDEELQARLEKFENGSSITRSSSFIDDTCGDDVVDGLMEALKSRSAKILRWLNESSKPLLSLHFSSFPENVTGVTCAISDTKVVEAKGYSIILSKTEQLPFYMLNAYPVDF